MKPDKPTQGDARHDEREPTSVQRDYEQLREFVVGGQQFVAGGQRRAAEAASAAHGAEGAGHKVARGSQTQITIDELVAKNRSIVERVRPIVRRAAGRLRARFRRT